MVDQPIHKANQIKIGDWCVMRNVLGENETGCLLGNVISFRYVDGKTNKEKKYSCDFASIGKGHSYEGSSVLGNFGEKKYVEIFASWYQMELDNPTTQTLKFVRNTFIHTQYYVANLSFDVIQKQPNKTIYLSRKYLKSIKNILRNFLENTNI